MRLGIFQILEKAAGQKASADKIAVLHANAGPALYTILKYAYDPNIVWDLPEGIPPYKPCPFPAQEMRLMSEIRRLYLFIKGGNPNLTKLRRETLFIELLESVHPDDALVLISIKDKKLPYKGLTVKLIKEAFPGLIEELPANDEKAKS